MAKILPSRRHRNLRTLHQHPKKHPKTKRQHPRNPPNPNVRPPRTRPKTNHSPIRNPHSRQRRRPTPNRPKPKIREFAHRTVREIWHFGGSNRPETEPGVLF